MLFYTNLCCRWVRRVTRSVCKDRCATCPSRDGNWLVACVVATAECRAGKRSTRPRRRHGRYRGYQSTPHVCSTTTTTGTQVLYEDTETGMFSSSERIRSVLRYVSIISKLCYQSIVEYIRVGIASYGTTWKHWNSNSYGFLWLSNRSSICTQKLLLL
jgi:hypothetical protein